LVTRRMAAPTFPFGGSTMKSGWIDSSSRLMKNPLAYLGDA